MTGFAGENIGICLLKPLFLEFGSGFTRFGAVGAGVYNEHRAAFFMCFFLFTIAAGRADIFDCTDFDGAFLVINRFAHLGLLAFRAFFLGHPGNSVSRRENISSSEVQTLIRAIRELESHAFFNIKYLK